jgi:4'-phosphopantetheinyl transferase
MRTEVTFYRNPWIRLMRVSRMPQATQNQCDWLNTVEQRRLDAISVPKRRQQFLAGHWLAREMAAEVWGGSPQSWNINNSSTGAPQLVSRDFDFTAAHLSLSHSGDWVVAAIAAFPIGIDLECAAKPRNLLALADAVFSEEERADLRCLPDTERAAAFYLYWTLKEASGKREGHGLRADRARKQRPVECAAEQAELLSWQFFDCALALAGIHGLPVHVDGIPDGARQRHWRIESAGH